MNEQTNVVSEVTVASVTKSGKPRKGRSDKGQARGKYKKKVKAKAEVSV